MKRRTFILQAGLASGGSITTVTHAAERIAGAAKPPGGIRWKRTSSSSLYSSVVCDGEPLVTGELPGLLGGRCRLWSEAPEKTTHLGPGKTTAQHGPLRVELRHQLHDTGAGVGVSNGWVEFTGLTSLDETAKARYLNDIAALF